MLTPEGLLADAFERHSCGDPAGALAIAKQLLSNHDTDPRLFALAGVSSLQIGQSSEAVDYLRHAVAIALNDESLRANLAFALINIGQLDEARHAASTPSVPRLWRITAFIDQRQGRRVEAIAGFRRVLSAIPTDAESWNNLGLLLLEGVEPDEAAAAFRRTLALKPDQPKAHIALARALAAAGRHIERQQTLRHAVATLPTDPALFVALGLAEGAIDEFAAAEAAYRRALMLDPSLPSVYLEYGMLLEKLNRLDDLDSLIVEARGRGVEGTEIDFIDAWAHKRRGRFTRALPLAEAAMAGSINPARLAQLTGEIADRLGDADRAFAAFAEMNRLDAVTPASRRAKAANFPGEIAATIARLTPASVARWTRSDAKKSRPSPVFIVGFPRSGTTLLDTLLMNVPDFDVLEEVPAIERVAAMLEDPASLPTLSDAATARLRDAYFNTISQAVSDGRQGRTLIDKFPLNLVRADIIHRLFPDAHFVLVERHPCDVVLSCFLSRFQSNRAMVQFLDLADAARLYNLAFEAWSRAASLLPLRIHTIRYERMIGDLESELRALFASLDWVWRPQVLDNRASAARREHIATPSYTQVTEPIYTHAVGRWERYRRHLAPVLPVLARWIEQMGYTA